MAVITSAMTCKKIILEKIDLKKIMTVLSVRHCGRGAIATGAKSASTASAMDSGLRVPQ
jgi:hypothetical protein